MNLEDLQGVIHSDPEIMGGTPVFAGTRVPLQNLIDTLEGGESIGEFLEGFPSVSRAQVIAVIEAGRLKMLVLPPFSSRLPDSFSTSRPRPSERLTKRKIQPKLI